MRTTPPSKIKDFTHLPLHRGGLPLRRNWDKVKAFWNHRHDWWFSLSDKNRTVTSPVFYVIARSVSGACYCTIFLPFSQAKPPKTQFRFLIPSMPKHPSDNENTNITGKMQSSAQSKELEFPIFGWTASQLPPPQRL